MSEYFVSIIFFCKEVILFRMEILNDSMKVIIHFCFEARNSVSFYIVNIMRSDSGSFSDSRVDLLSCSKSLRLDWRFDRSFIIMLRLWLWGWRIVSYFFCFSSCSWLLETWWLWICYLLFWICKLICKLNSWFLFIVFSQIPIILIIFNEIKQSNPYLVLNIKACL